ncbi:MAG: (2Fe-2S)-binding protein [Candidatus Rariloculaceae bacterium]
MIIIQINVNGNVHDVDVEDSTPLLYVLRNDLGLSGPRFGCGLAQCGTCTVLVEGTPIRSCVTPVSGIADKPVTTLEGLGNRANPHPIQEAFIAEQAGQCGYCSNGMIMAAAALLEENPDPTDEEIRKALAGNLCRCGTHTRIIKAVQRAAQNYA